MTVQYENSEMRCAVQCNAHTPGHITCRKKPVLWREQYNPIMNPGSVCRYKYLWLHVHCLYWATRSSVRIVHVCACNTDTSLQHCEETTDKVELNRTLDNLFFWEHSVITR